MNMTFADKQLCGSLSETILLFIQIPPLPTLKLIQKLEMINNNFPYQQTNNESLKVPQTITINFEEARLSWNFSYEENKISKFNGPEAAWNPND